MAETSHACATPEPPPHRRHPGQGLLRVDQILARYGYASRREAASWVRAGRVRLEDELLADPAKRVDPRRVTIDGAPVEAPEGLLVMLHKPLGVVCSRDTREGPNVYDLLPPRWSLRHPAITSVGRLDKDTTGLLLLTDTGEWVHRWTSPRKEIEKTYEIVLDAEPDPGAIALFESGTLRLDGEPSPCRPARLELLGSRSARLHLTEGRFHQVRRMFAAIGRFVLKLHRSRFGTYELGDLPEGSWKILGPP